MNTVLLVTARRQDRGGIQIQSGFRVNRYAMKSIPACLNRAAKGYHMSAGDGCEASSDVVTDEQGCILIGNESTGACSNLEPEGISRNRDLSVSECQARTGIDID